MAADEAQRKVVPDIIAIDGHSVASYGENPSIAHMMKAKRALRIMVQWNEKVPDTFENWSTIYKTASKAQVLPDVVECCFHMQSPPTHAKSMHGKMHKERPTITALVEHMLEGITDGVPEAITYVQASKKWNQEASVVELILVWL